MKILVAANTAHFMNLELQGIEVDRRNQMLNSFLKKMSKREERGFYLDESNGDDDEEYSP